jgi:hypothetical protein
VDRQAFLKHTARPAAISNLQVDDVRVRLLGDFAIVHARTIYIGSDGRTASGRYIRMSGHVGTADGSQFQPT